MKKLVFYIIFAVALFASLIGNLRQHAKIKEMRNTPGTYKIVKKLVHDTLYVPTPQPSEVIYMPVPADIDTAAILADYHNSYIYVDTVHIGQYIDLSVTDSVACNKLISHTFEVLSIPEIIEVPPNAGFARCLAFGAVAGYNMAIVKADMTVNRHTFSVGYDVRNKMPVAGYSFRIFSWK